MTTLSRTLVIKDDDGRRMIQCIGSISPKVGFMCFPFPRSQLLDGGFISVQNRLRQQSLFQRIPERREMEPCATDPVAHGGLG
jgi:hypothetical protein